MFNRIWQYRRGVVSIWSMFGFLMMPTLYLDGRLTGFAKATKTSAEVFVAFANPVSLPSRYRVGRVHGAAKVYWRQLNSKRSLC